MQKSPILNHRRTSQRLMEARNDVFNGLPKRQQRIAIAKEAVRLSRKQVLRPVSGMGYCFPYGVGVKDPLDQIRLMAPEFQCRVCHLGGAVVTAMRLGNGAVRSANDIAQDMQSIITTWFGLKQAALMEVAFEGIADRGINNVAGRLILQKGQSPFLLSDRAIQRAKHFHFRHKSRERVSVAIWENVIANNGTFIP